MIARVRVTLDIPLDHTPVEPEWEELPVTGEGKTPALVMKNEGKVYESRIKAAKHAETKTIADLKKQFGKQFVDALVEEVRE